MFNIFSLVVMILVVLFLMAGGVRTLIHRHIDKSHDNAELVITCLVLLVLFFYGAALVTMLFFEVFQ